MNFWRGSFISRYPARQRVIHRKVRGEDRGVAEQRLNDPDVGAVLQQVGGEASDMLRGGVSLPALMRLMGHAHKTTL
jgi:hypothetical protein